MMKWLGLLLVVCSGGGIGFLYAMRLRQERTNLERLCQMLREIAVQIAFRSLTVQELLEANGIQPEAGVLYCSGDI